MFSALPTMREDFVTEQPARRASRADKGIIRLTARDREALLWLYEMRAVYEDDLALVLSPTVPIGLPAVRAVVRRWQRAGVARADRIFMDRGRIVRLTLDGARLVADVDRWSEGAVTTAVHTAEVARIRLTLEARGEIAGNRIVGWVSERAWRSEFFEAVRRGAHAPDGIAVLESAVWQGIYGDQVAVEVERTNHGLARTRKVLVDLMDQYPVTIYAVPKGADAIARTVQTAYEQARRLMREQQRSRIGELYFLIIPESLPEERPDTAGQESQRS